MVNGVIVEGLDASVDVKKHSTQVMSSLHPIMSKMIYYDVVSHGVTNSLGRTDLVDSD